jgi:hypothetical protein
VAEAQTEQDDLKLARSQQADADADAGVETAEVAVDAADEPGSAPRV